MDNVKSAIVYRASNYELFETLKGNRGVTDSRTEKIKRSIGKVGYIMSPIIVNEKYEIIDGQGRLSALKDLGLPVDYIIVPNIGLEECQQMNINQSNWTLIDFIKSYADGGNPSYEYLFKLYCKYKRLGITVVYSAVSGLAAMDSAKVKSGAFSCTEEDYKNAIEILNFEENFIDVVKKVKGRADYIFIAIGFCYKHEEVDNELLLIKLQERGDMIHSPANVEQTLDQISDIYNFKNRRKKVYLSTDYKRMLDEKYRWYSKKYASDNRARHYSLEV